ncbi:TonB-dependent receptor [Novosphingobium sp. FSY-8]|uniref:TonB-dependent receptor n=1 Tax=Novosphingobium ovatum TaxID=1908523 RepID=A0ABW9XD05_9SPHN|nr:TonB-dependent receptor [Novosphingobium ovatum]NBC36418.1 TonB-dependent receptor [Novosphingobium ovatum]
MKKSSYISALFVSACCVAATAPAFAQAAPDSEIKEIIVTAQNRKENVQNVPIAISVVSGEALKSRGVTDFTSVQKVSPALQITSDTNNTRVTVRGIGSLTNNEAQDQSIAVNIDGEYLNRPTILNAAIFDLDRVEVLRGPQGTLYGRNSTGGAVNFITRKPGERNAFNGSVSYGNFNALHLEAGADLVLGEAGAIRVAGFFRQHDGYSYHANTPFSPSAAFVPSTSNRSDDDHTGGVRISMRLKPVAGLTIDGSVEHVEQDVIPAAQMWTDMTGAAYNPGTSTTTCGNGWTVAGTTVGGVQCVPSNINVQAGRDRSTFNSPLIGVGSLHQISTALRARVAYDLGFATLTYTGGYRSTKNTGGNALSPAFFFTNYGGRVKTQSHELRLNGTMGGVQWQTGVFYFYEKQNTNGGLYSPFIGANGSYVNYFRHPTNSKSLSGFGQVEVPLTDKLTAVVGARYTQDDRDAAFTNYAFAFGSGPIELTTQPSTTTQLGYSGSKFTWAAGLNYKPNSATMIYAKVSTGYKAGGFDGAGTNFRAETNTAYEGGVKLKLGQHILNFAGFYYDYKDLQNDVLLNPAIGAQTFNAGKARIYGLEIDSTLRITPNDTLTTSINLLHAKYVDFTASIASYNIGTAPTSPLTANLAGNRLPQTPNFVITLGYDHVFRLGGAGTLTFSAFTRYKGNYYLDFYNYASARQGERTQTDLSLEYKPANKRYSVQAFVRNLEDYRSMAYAGNTVVPGVANIYNFQFAAPRTYGVRLGVDF